MELSSRWLELAAPAWHNVFARLHPKDLGNLIMTCRHLHNLADVAVVWQVQCKKWPHPLAQPQLGGYQSWKALVLDDNRRSAVLTLPLQTAVCTYRYQRHSYFFQCRILQLQWWRGSNSLRMYFDVRGETDLRHPMTSTLAVVQMQAEQQQRVRQQLGRGIPTRSVVSAAASGVADGNEAAAAADARSSSGVEWQQQFCVCRPDSCELVTNKPGHYKGVLVWESAKCSEILGKLFSASRVQQIPPEQHRHEQCGRRSQAWEDWTDWQLHQGAGEVCAWGVDALPAAAQAGVAAGQQHKPAPAAAAGGAGTGPDWFWNVLQAATSGFAQPSNGAASSSRSEFAGTSAAGTHRGLVFCYANDLGQFSEGSFYMYGRPDYTTALLIKAPETTQLTAPAVTDRTLTAAAADVAAASAALDMTSSTAISRHASPAGATATAVDVQSAAEAPRQPGSSESRSPDPSLDLPVCSVQLPVQMHLLHEPRWVHAWLQLPGATVVQRGLADTQLRAESEADEKARWADLPAGVKRRGAAWWK